MRTVILSIAAAFTLTACKDACEKLADDITAKYEDCGVDLPESDGGDDSSGDTECDKEQAECYSGCYTDADCAAFTGGTSADALDALTSWSDCVAAC